MDVANRAPLEELAPVRVPALDGLRGVAAYAVVVSHFSSMTKSLEFPFWQAGRLGVMLFFVLSGFLMGRIYLARPLSGRALTDFAVKRVARVVPLYLVLVLVSFATVAATGSAWVLFDVDAGNLAEHLLFLKGTDVLWTVAVEVQFYAVFPLVWLLASRRGTGEALLGLVLLIGLLALFSSRGLPTFFNVAAFFLLGLMASKVHLQRSRGTDALFVMFAIAVLLSLPRVRAAIGFPSGAGWGSMLHMATMFGVLASAANSNLADRLLGNRPMVFLGAISYSVYLLHLPVLRVLKGGGLLDGGVVLSLALVLITVTVVAAASFRLIENPARRFVTGKLHRPGAVAPALVADALPPRGLDSGVNWKRSAWRYSTGFALVASCAYLAAGQRHDAPPSAGARVIADAYAGAVDLPLAPVVRSGAAGSIGVFELDDRKRLHIRGWALDVARREGTEMVLFILGGRVLASIPPELDRPDVARKAGSGALRSGFDIRIETLPQGVEPCAIVVAALQHDGSPIRLRNRLCRSRFAA